MAGNQDGFGPLGLAWKLTLRIEASRETDQQVWGAIVGLDGIGVEVLSGCPAVVQETGAGPGLEISGRRRGDCPPASIPFSVKRQVGVTRGIPEGQVLRIEAAVYQDWLKLHPGPMDAIGRLESK